MPVREQTGLRQHLPRIANRKGLIDGLAPDELRVLLAYLISGRDPSNQKIYERNERLEDRILEESQE